LPAVIQVDDTVDNSVIVDAFALQTTLPPTAALSTNVVMMLLNNNIKNLESNILVPV